ncbi:N-formylglutamate amidohydrolase [Devosia yakushimensis]|uniref:N-formylglutamate amidohydrolase n=1 Tax=Devosia yakushimensis TaxID=470028 RepID=A0ABQ5U7T5_9HYPH|nr:N-formylglutamate amidohydrolase [Devosia yakushimensis]GLQ08167.1 N-formylglutamate amidohydrolase [Devosia yakushimensis]
MDLAADADGAPVDPNITVNWNADSEVPLLLSFPHSGATYPDDFGYDASLPFNVVDYPSDKYVDELFDGGAALGLGSIRANFPRAYIDVNRHQHDIDGTMLEAPERWYGRMQPTALRNGTTLFWSKAKEIDLYDRKLSHAEAKRRLATCHVVYHQALTTMIETTRRKHGSVVVLDCHSMMRFDTTAQGSGERPEVDIGTRYGESCDPDLAVRLVECFETRGYQVGLNRRFAGGEITLRYGWPEIDQHLLQIELRRDLYMDEETRLKNDRFDAVRQDCSDILSEFRQFVQERQQSRHNTRDREHMTMENANG